MPSSNLGKTGLLGFHILSPPSLLGKCSLEGSLQGLLPLLCLDLICFLSEASGISNVSDMGVVGHWALRWWAASTRLFKEQLCFASPLEISPGILNLLYDSLLLLLAVKSSLCLSLQLGGSHL